MSEYEQLRIEVKNVRETLDTLISWLAAKESCSLSPEDAKSLHKSLTKGLQWDERNEQMKGKI